MSSSTNISALYREFADALTEVLAENAVGLARRGRHARRPDRGGALHDRLPGGDRLLVQELTDKHRSPARAGVHLSEDRTADQ